MAACAAEGVDPRVTGMTAWVDVAFLNEAGTPAVCFGPGSIAQAHSADEWIDPSRDRDVLGGSRAFCTRFPPGGSGRDGYRRVCGGGMSKDHPVQSSNIEVIRERAVEVLMEHFSNDVMDLDEFEGLLDAVNGCSTASELRELLSKLPPVESSEPATDMMPARGGEPVVVDADRVRDHGFMISVLAGSKRVGRWIPARRTFALGVLGGITLDFREALLGPGITELERAGDSERCRDHRPARDDGRGGRHGAVWQLRPRNRRAASGVILISRPYGSGDSWSLAA